MQRADWIFRAFTDGKLKLDGGAMFGVVPRQLWAKHHPPDERNRIEMVMRCLLVDHEDHRILVDCGCGDRWAEKQRDIFGFERQPNHLLTELAAAGVPRESITDVILTHLHFDHCGGAVIERPDGLEPAFPAARHWVQKKQWSWAFCPTDRDRASFRPEDFEPLEKAGLLEFVNGTGEILPGVRVVTIHGHTPGQQIVEFHTGDGVVAFVADLLPLASQLRVPWIMSYDLNPLLTLTEKKEFLSRAAEEDFTLVFEHDPEIEAAGVAFDGRNFQPTGPFRLEDR